MLHATKLMPQVSCPVSSRVCPISLSSLLSPGCYVMMQGVSARTVAHVTEQRGGIGGEGVVLFEFFWPCSFCIPPHPARIGAELHQHHNYNSLGDNTRLVSAFESLQVCFWDITQELYRDGGRELSAAGREEPGGGCISYSHCLRRRRGEGARGRRRPGHEGTAHTRQLS